MSLKLETPHDTLIRPITGETELPAPGTMWVKGENEPQPPASKPIPLVQVEEIDERYRIVTKLASGGMGDVYKAVHVDLNKTVAVKVMKRELGNDPNFVERFKAEAIACSHIGQHNIVDISDFGRTTDGRFYFVMEYLEGQTLTDLLRAEQRLTTERAIDITLQIARALNAAHSQGIVHRDLKPDNIIILQREDRPDFVKVLDFGVAKISDEGGVQLTTTGAGTLMGTPQYMSPEQASALPVDSRSDIYSLGLILYELLTGRKTFVGETPSLVIAAHIYQAPEPLGMAPELEAVVMHMLQKQPISRPQTMNEVIAALDLVTHPPVPHPLVPAPAFIDAVPHTRMPIAVLAGVMALFLTGAAWTWQRPPPVQMPTLPALPAVLVAPKAEPVAEPVIEAPIEKKPVVRKHVPMRSAPKGPARPVELKDVPY